MHVEHKPGDKLYIDYTGKKIPYVDRATGEVKEAEVLLTTLGHSEYTYVEACPSQSQECFAESLRHALEYYGGVPQVLVPDNLKSAVSKADKYEAEINSLLMKMAHHYDTVVLPARVRHPKDKSLVERHVRMVYQQIFAPLRNMTFFSIEEINAAIREPLRQLNERHFQGRPYSRKDLFEEEAAYLKPLQRGKHGKGTAFAAQHPVQQVQPVSVRKTVFEGSEPAYPSSSFLSVSVSVDSLEFLAGREL
jgi:transposase